MFRCVCVFGCRRDTKLTLPGARLGVVVVVVGGGIFRVNDHSNASPDCVDSV